jgi:hypothetical protein
MFQFASLVSFDGIHPGYVKWDRVQVPHSLQINLKFKTQSESGLIYHLVNADGTPVSSLALINGRLVLESQGAVLMTNSPDIRFNDNEWHVITATHNETSLRLDIDDSEDESTNSAPYPQEINNGALYVGNVPDDASSGLKFEPFVGCIGDTTLNGVIVNFANSTERPYAHLSQCNRPDQMISSNHDPALSVYPSPPPSSWQELTTTVVDPGLGVEDYQVAGPVQDRISGGDDDDATAAPITVIQTTSSVMWPTSTKEPETVDGCRLPHYPATDPDQSIENAWRFGTLRINVDTRQCA